MISEDVKERIEAWAGGYIRRNPNAFLTSTGISTISALIEGAESEYLRSQSELQKRDELLKEFAEAFSSIQILQQQTGKVLSPLDPEYVDSLLSKYNNLKV